MIKLTDSEFHFLVDYLKQNYGINLAQKRVLMEGRLGVYLAENGFNSYTEYINALKQDRSGKELTNLLNRVTTNHTYFMREADHFTYFQETLLPFLEKNVRSRDLRVWCAAASTGEEPYTLAMILEDYFGGKLPKWDKRLLATDLSLKVLEQAQEGIYTEEGVMRLSAHWRDKYFEKLPDGRYQVTRRLRDEIIFRRFNLMDPIVVRKPFHVVFCRNVMIYFDTPTKDSLVERIYDALYPGGYLFTGHTEFITNPSRFQYVKPSIYRKGV